MEQTPNNTNNMKTFINSDRFEIMKKATLFLLLFCFVTTGYSQVTLSDKQQDKKSFPIVTSAAKAVVCYDEADAEVVRRTAGLLVEDVNRVTNKKLKLVSDLPSKQEYIILAGTLGKNKAIDRLVVNKKIDVSRIRNGWEQYAIDLIDNPFPGIKKALVVVGSDRRGTAYGLFSISETIGVSPWYWWADVPVVKKKSLCLNVNT